MKVLLISVFILFSCDLWAQVEGEFVVGTFRGTTLINGQTVEMISPKSFDFTIRHRFGMIGLDSTAYQQFLGLDLPANIRFGFGLPLSERINIGFGRTKNGKTIDAEGKFLFLRQDERGKRPASAALFFSVAMNTMRFSAVPEYAFFGDSITPFEYKFIHRLSYVTQVIIARKISEKISIQIAPTFVYKNLVPFGVSNHTATIPIGGVIKTGISSSFIFEYAYRFDNHPPERNYPASIAWEFGTVGHVFQIVISSSAELIEQDLYTNKGFNYLKGKFALGFNLRRTTWINKEK